MQRESLQRLQGNESREPTPPAQVRSMFGADVSSLPAALCWVVMVEIIGLFKGPCSIMLSP